MGNEVELIALVRNCEFLYDKSLPDYKDAVKKNAAWEAIAAVMKASVLEVQQRWRSLREAYNKHKKEVEFSDGSKAVKHWEFFEDMKFIEPHIMHRKFTLLSDCSDGSKREKLEAYQEYTANTQLLIATVRQRPILYDDTHLGFRDKSKKQKAWKEVSEVLGFPNMECQTKWKTLRDRYARERKLINEGYHKRKWHFFDNLTFLDQHVKVRRAFGARPSAIKCRDDESPEPDNDTLDYIDSDDVFSKEVIAPEFVDASGSPQPEENETQHLKDLTRSPTNDYSGHSRSHDEDDLFGQTIAAELRRIPSTKKKMKIKADMYRLLYENESD